MAEITISDKGPNISRTDIEDFQKKFNIQFSEDYINFILKYNGGEPQPNLVSYEDRYGRRNRGVYRFLSLNNDRYSVEKFLDIYTYRIPNDFIPIAQDTIGNVFCISVKEENYGKVYIWHHEEEADDEFPYYGNVFFIANNFTDFLKLLY